MPAATCQVKREHYVHPVLRRGLNLRDICPLRRPRFRGKSIPDSLLVSASLSRATDDSPWAVEVPRCRHQQIGPEQRLHFRTPVSGDEGLSRCAIPAALSFYSFCPAPPLPQSFSGMNVWAFLINDVAELMSAPRPITPTLSSLLTQEPSKVCF
jgi:hypothetical protein